MTIEIELKLAISSKTIAQLPQFMRTVSIIEQSTLFLVNTYYDTPHCDLKKNKSALRIRETQGQYEMTLKSGGQSIGGLHQRQEINIPLMSPVLDFTLLADKSPPIFTDLAAQLQPLFTTNFTRQRWLIKFRESQIEVALDSGVITAATKELPIQELELELISGSVHDLLAFAYCLSELGGLVLSVVSKATRGYQLLGESPCLDDASSIAPITTLEQGLHVWQQVESRWLAQHNATTLRSVIVQLQQIIVRNNANYAPMLTTKTVQALDKLLDLIGLEHDAAHLLQCPVYLQAKLAILDAITIARPKENQTAQ